MDQDELMLKLIEKDIDLYKFYLGVIITLSGFVFGTTGAVMTYHQTNYSNPFIGYSLIFPALLNVGSWLICRGGIGPASKLAEGIERRASILKSSRCFYAKEAIGIYDFQTLPKTLRLFSWLYYLTTLGILVLLMLWRAQVH